MLFSRVKLLRYSSMPNNRISHIIVPKQFHRNILGLLVLDTHTDHPITQVAASRMIRVICAEKIINSRSAFCNALSSSDRSFSVRDMTCQNCRKKVFILFISYFFITQTIFFLGRKSREGGREKMGGKGKNYIKRKELIYRAIHT